MIVAHPLELASKAVLPNGSSHLEGTTEIDDLDVIVSGPTPPNPAELLDSEKMEELIKKLNIQDFKEINIKGKLSNTNVMFTGGFEKISRSEAKTLTENLGGNE